MKYYIYNNTGLKCPFFQLRLPVPERVPVVVSHRLHLELGSVDRRPAIRGFREERNLCLRRLSERGVGPATPGVSIGKERKVCPGLKQMELTRSSAGFVSPTLTSIELASPGPVRQPSRS